MLLTGPWWSEWPSTINAIVVEEGDAFAVVMRHTGGRTDDSRHELMDDPKLFTFWLLLSFWSLSRLSRGSWGPGCCSILLRGGLCLRW